MNAKRLALVGPFHPYRGGIAHFQHATARTLIDRGHEVLPVTFSRQYPSLLFPGKTQVEASEVGASLTAARTIDTLLPWTWWRTAANVRAWRPDAVVFTYWMPFFAPAFGTIARRVTDSSTRVLSLVHNAVPHERRIGDAALSRYFLRANHGAVVFSAAVANDLEKLASGLPVRRIQHPVYDVFGAPQKRSEARSRLGLDPDAPVALFFGYVRRYKGLHVLLEAMSSVAEQVPGVQLVVAGEFYEDEGETRRTIQNLGLDAVVRVHAEYIDNERVATFFSAADVVVQPYVSATQSGVAQVAFHFERPMILTDVGGLAEVVPHERAGLVVPPRDAPALAAALVRFFVDTMGPTLEAGVRAEKQRFSWDRLGEAVEELLAQG